MELAKLSNLHMRLLVQTAETRSLSKACFSLCLSRPNGSRLLNEMRKLFNDKLFIKSSRGMYPTDYLNNMLPFLKKCIELQTNMMNKEHAFMDNEYLFRIACMDSAFSLFLSEAISLALQKRSNLRFEIVPIQTKKVLSDLNNGFVDFLIYPLQLLPIGFHELPLRKAARSLIVRKGHPLVEKYKVYKTISAEDINKFEIIRTQVKTDFDAEFDVPIKKDINTNPAVTLPYIYAAPYVVCDTNCLWPVADWVAKELVELYKGKLVMLPLGTDASQVDTKLIWHDRTHDSPIHQWFRSLIKTLLTDKDRKRPSKPFIFAA